MSQIGQGMAWTASAVLQLLLVTLGALAVTSGDEVRVPPSIVTPRERKQLIFSENEAVTLACQAEGKPQPTYKWLWNNNEITSQFISYSTVTGMLTIPRLSTREEGLFVCHATNTFSNGRTATDVSENQEVRVGRVGDFEKRPSEYYSGKEGEYLMIPCDKNIPEYYGPITFRWYLVVGGTNSELREEDNQHITIDQAGNLHFMYLKKSDDSLKTNPYKCAVSSNSGNRIKLGNSNDLNVTASTLVPESAPKLQFTTNGTFLTAEVGKNATLECVFSGYVASSGKTVPSITWYEQDGHAIVNGGRYDIIKDGLALVIVNVTEDDEKVYKCRGQNSLGSAEGSLSLNVTSRPIWVHPMESVTAVQGRHVEFACITRSAKGEQSPNQPSWSMNGNQWIVDPNKHQFNVNKTILTVKYVDKDMDIACYQCYVANSVGKVQDDGCLNVVVPIQITVRPQAEQSVRKGEQVNLTTLAITDPLFEDYMTYSWIFKNQIYAGSDVPPHVTYDTVNNLAYIDTSALTDQELKDIEGIYSRKISHPVETIYVDVIVNVLDELTKPTQAETDCKRNENVVAVIVLALVLTVVLVLNVVAVIWFWRRGWTFPCADNKNQRHTELNQPNATSEDYVTPVTTNGSGDYLTPVTTSASEDYLTPVDTNASEDYLTPVTTNGTNRGEGEGCRHYETLRLEDVAMRSPYAELQQEINTQEISHYEVL